MNGQFEGVFVLGFPRSGTTLLRRLLNSHPDLACPAETNLMAGASRFLSEAEMAGGLSVGVISGLSFSGFSEEEILDRLREFLFGFWRDIRRDAKKRYWVEKTAVDVFHLDAIERLCGPRCRYICIVRHPLDTVCSLVDLTNKMQCHLPEVYEYVRRYRSQVEAYARAWAEANYRLAKFIDQHSDLCIVIRYEDLVQNAESVIGDVSDFLGLPVDSSALIERAMSDRKSVGLGDWKTYEKHKISTESVNRHSGLGKWTVNKLAPIVNPLLPQFGYQEIGATGTRSDLQSERSRALARMVAGMNLAGTDQQTDE